MKKIIFILILVVMATSMCIQEPQVEGTYDVNYHDVDFLFNSNLEEAQNISVIPDKETLKEVLFGYNVAELQLANYDNSTEFPYYGKSLVSFASKYAKMSLITWNYDMKDKVAYVVLNETDHIPNATINNPAILLMGPAFTEKTYILVDDYVVKVYGNNLEMRTGKYAGYTDFDLALDKIIMVLMEE